MTETLKYKFMQLKGIDTNPVHFTVYFLSIMTTCENIHIQPTTDRLKVLQEETGERGSAVCGVECTRHNSATGNAKYTELPAVNVN